MQLLWGEPPEALAFPWVYPLLTAAAVVTLAAAVAVGKLWPLVMVAVLVVNGTIHFSTRVRWQPVEQRDRKAANCRLLR